MSGLVAEDAIRDVYEDVQHKTRSKAPAALVWIIPSPWWKSGTARALHLPLSLRSHHPRLLHPVPLLCLAPRPRVCNRVKRGKYSAVKPRVFLPMAVGCSISCESYKA